MSKEFVMELTTLVSGIDCVVLMITQPEMVDVVTRSVVTLMEDKRIARVTIDNEPLESMRVYNLASDC